MQIIHNLFDTKSPTQLETKHEIALAIGNFDGVHLGHQAILHTLHQNAKQHNLHTAAMFFEPQPKEYFAKLNGGVAPPRISSWQEKCNFIAKQDIDYAFVTHFNDDFRSQSAQEFCEKLQACNVTHVMVGDDFRFGNDRKGDSKFLQEFGFTVDHLPTVEHKGARISSTRVRNCLQQGDFTTAQELLGRKYSITGVVEKGDQIGRTIDFPTANVALGRDLPCLEGIYAVEVSLHNGENISSLANEQKGLSGISSNTIFGCAHVGTRPAIKDKPPEWRLEVHFPEFTGDLYGAELTVTFLHFLHGVKNYDGLEALKAGIKQDTKDLLAWRQKAVANA